MAVRTTMATLIASVRDLVADPSNPLAAPPVVPVFTDQQIQDALDHTRRDVRYLELASAATIQSGGVVVWLDYYAMSGSVGLGDWEDDIALQSYTFAPLTPATSDTLVGHWTFTSDTRPPVYCTGKVYDRYMAASDILRKWVATLKLTAYDVRTADQSVRTSQRIATMLQLAKEYDAKARPRTLQKVRSDQPQELWQRHNFDITRTTF